MEPKLIKTTETEISNFLAFNTRLDKFGAMSESAEAPHLAFLRIELTRLRAGMSDFIFKASAPSPVPGAKATVVTLRGDKSFAKTEGLVAAAKVIFRELDKREDDTHEWTKADATYLANMMINHCKFFVINLNTDQLQFTTDAIH
jgi:hypothetical protein